MGAPPTAEPAIVSNNESMDASVKAKKKKSKKRKLEEEPASPSAASTTDAEPESVSEEKAAKRARKEAKKLAKAQAQEKNQVEDVKMEVDDAEVSKAEKKARKAAKKEAKAQAAAAEAETKKDDESTSTKSQEQNKEQEQKNSEDKSKTQSEDQNEFRKENDITVAKFEESDVIPDPVWNFEKDVFPFAEEIRLKMTKEGFTKPSPIQAQAWPIANNKRDLIAVAKTGSGKTLAFLLPAFHQMSLKMTNENKQFTKPQVLVMTPTRELAGQIEEAAIKFCDSSLGNPKTQCLSLYGGVDKWPQIKALKDKSNPPKVLVATPGRLVDLMGLSNDDVTKQGPSSVDLTEIFFLVLDEGDRMLDMGFEPQMKKIMKTLDSNTESKRQTMLFSATWPKSIKKLAASYLNKPLHINVGETEELAANKSISQIFFALNDAEKDNKLWKELDKLDDKEKCIVFANTKRRVEALSRVVHQSGYNCCVMSGDKTQQERDAGLKKFQSGQTSLMIATDVCARGLDISGVTHVVNYDMARDVESYIHRIGRTGRAGSKGTSITFVNEDFDVPCSPALAKIAEEAGQEVPAFLKKLVEKAKRAKSNKLWKY